MNYSISFFPEVEDDAISGYRWYEGKAIGLGEEFLRLFYAISGEITRNPLIYPLKYKGLRRCLLRRFPYAIYYRVNKQKVVVYALFHCARNPTEIERNLSARGQKN